jgi:antitoxin (DNA-binding transcriptional repressor) of toxin-antitoxin stability system
MIYQMTLDEAKTRLLDLIEAAIKGNEVFILKDEQQAIQLVPVEPPKRQPQFGSAEGLVVMADDFDAPLEDFNEYDRTPGCCGEVAISSP